MNTKWILKNGNQTTEYTSFPYAFRVMYNIVRKASETKGVDTASVMRGLSLVAPHKDRFGNTRVYSYATATQMATDQGLLTPDGQINSREFKRSS